MDSDDNNFPIISSEKESRLFAYLGLKCLTAVPEKGLISFHGPCGVVIFLISLPPTTSPMIHMY